METISYIPAPDIKVGMVILSGRTRYRVESVDKNPYGCPAHVHVKVSSGDKIVSTKWCFDFIGIAEVVA